MPPVHVAWPLKDKKYLFLKVLSGKNSIAKYPTKTFEGYNCYSLWNSKLKEVSCLFRIFDRNVISLRGNAIKTKHSFTNTVHSWQVVALPLKSQLGGSFSMALGDIIHVLGRPRCGLCCVKKMFRFITFLLELYRCVYSIMNY